MRYARAILNRIGIWWEKYYIMHAKIDINLIEQKYFELTKDKNYEIRRLEYADFSHADKSFVKKQKLAKYKKWFADDKREAYGIFIDGVLACSGWICYGRFEITGRLSFLCGDNFALLQDAYTNSLFRQKGLHKLINIYRIKKVYEKGINEVFTIVRWNNTPALKTQSYSTLKVGETVSVYSIFKNEFMRFSKNDYK